MGEACGTTAAEEEDESEDELEAVEDMEKERVFPERYPLPCIGLLDTHGGGVSFPPISAQLCSRLLESQKTRFFQCLRFASRRLLLYRHSLALFRGRRKLAKITPEARARVALQHRSFTEVAGTNLISS